ncbi:MAG TPA: hypothetical protein VN634_18610 [Candidatus Limnocylindrales bacterium]|nr:hypothetical protein [Candidatus Limnocylindrales bacterium]
MIRRSAHAYLGVSSRQALRSLNRHTAKPSRPRSAVCTAGCALLGAASIVLSYAHPAHSQGSFYNWETPPVHPVEMTPDGTRLLVTNTADARLEVFTLGGALPVHTASIPVGLEPVSVRARTNSEAWVTNKISDSVSVVDLTTHNVVTSFSPGDEPCDVVFAGSPQRAYISVAQQNEVAVYDPASLAAPTAIVPILGKDVRSLATDGTRVYAAIFESGNRSMILPESIVSDPSGPYGGANPPPNSGATFNPPIAGGLPAPPTTSLIINKEGVNWKDDNNHIWDALVTWNLNENDVAMIQTSNLSVTYAKNLLNINAAMTINPANGRVYVVGTYGPNEHRFFQSAQSNVRQRIASFDPANIGAIGGVADLNPHLFLNPPSPQFLKTSVTQAEHDMSVADPRGIAWKTDGSAVWISGMGSNNIMRANSSGQRVATIDVGEGPTGLALDEPRQRLYVWNRFEGSISSIDTAANTEVGRTTFFDPTPQVIKAGRPFLYDAHLTSRLGSEACAGCHIDATRDTEAWDLGDPSGAMKTLDEPCNTGTGLAGVCADWHPMKGPMMTQTLIGSVGTEPLHWRGDREDIGAFTSGFVDLLGLSTPPTTPEMNALEAFLATTHFPPNPYRTFDDATPATVPGYAGDPANGETLFMTAPIFNGTTACVTCHTLPTGGNGIVISPNLINESQGIAVPQLRDLYKKIGLDYSSLTNNRGFGFGHDGSFDTLFDLLKQPQFGFPAGAAGDAERRDIEAFLLSFPTDTHAAVGTQLTVLGANDNSVATVNLLNAMIALADAGDVGLVAKGRMALEQRGWVYVAGTGVFQSDRAAEAPTANSLRQSGAAGGEITFTVVPLGTQARLGVDRDEDTWFDSDEIDAGTDPADASSHPSGSGGDSDADGISDAIDNCPGGANASQADADGDGYGDACDPCTSGASMNRPLLIAKNLVLPAGDESLKIKGSATVPTSPAIDPATNGLRIIVSDAIGNSLLDVTVAGGASWTTSTSGFKYWGPKTGGIGRIGIKTSSAAPGFVKIGIKGKGLTMPAASATLPLRATIVIDTPIATTGQCADGDFPGPSPLPQCSTASLGSTIVCK